MKILHFIEGDNLSEKVKFSYFFSSGFVAVISGCITFFVCWIYAINHWGWFLGISVGWIPSAIIALMVSGLAFLFGVPVIAIFTCVLIWEALANGSPNRSTAPIIDAATEASQPEDASPAGQNPWDVDYGINHKPWGPNSSAALKCP